MGEKGDMIMEMTRAYVDFAVQKTKELLAIDSPTGYTAEAIAWVKREFEALGCETKISNKGACLITVGGEGDGLLLAAHTDTLGGMVAEVKGNGRLRITNLGGFLAVNTETENVRIHTRDGKIYEGTIQLNDPSAHVNDKVRTAERNFDTVQVVIDEDVKNAAETRALGIEAGDYVCAEPRFRVTESGYIKSRFLDDKLSVGTLLALVKYIRDHQIALSRKLYVFVTVYEEVGHGGSAGIPADVTEGISVDMGCVGEGLMATEKDVSICAKDATGPYDYRVTDKLVKAARKEGASYAIDVYPHYGSDVEASLRAGYDIRHGCIGAGVYASHGYERSHVDGVMNLLKTLKGYLEI